MTYALGRLVQHDPRSLAFPAELAPLRTVTHRHYGPVLDQGELGSCTGNAIAQALNCTPLRRGRVLLTEADAVKLYSRATVLDEFDGSYPPEDTGSSGLAVCKAAKEAGLIKAYHHAFGVDQALAALVLSPIIIGVPWYDEMFFPDSNGYLNIRGDMVGGHEVSLIAINVKKERVTLLNNWSSQWGINGRAYLRFADLDALLKQQGDATVPVN
jgi:hypothetical protein